ncbi:MAG: Gfo/Idh/MocA family oxidoreductase [Steroidobacteraceae bacterium]
MTGLRVAIIGSGRMAAIMAAQINLMAEHGYALVAHCSRDFATSRRFASRFGSVASFVDLDDMLATAAPDLVYIASPPALHAAQMLACVRHGIAVLCEKPFAVSAEEASKVATAAAATGTFVMEAMWTRFLPVMSALHRLVAGQRVGPTRLITGGGAFLPDANAPDYLLSAQLGGGCLLDAGVYLVSLCHMLLGAPQSICANGLIGKTGVDEQFAALLSWPAAQALQFVSMRSRRPPDMEILGERGRIRIPAPVYCPLTLEIIDYAGTSEILEFPLPTGGYGYQLLEVKRCLARGDRQSTVMPLEETIAIMKSLDEIRRQIGAATATRDAPAVSH